MTGGFVKRSTKNNNRSTDWLTGENKSCLFSDLHVVVGAGIRQAVVTCFLFTHSSDFFDEISCCRTLLSLRAHGLLTIESVTWACDVRLKEMICIHDCRSVGEGTEGPDSYTRIHIQAGCHWALAAGQRVQSVLFFFFGCSVLTCSCWFRTSYHMDITSVPFTRRAWSQDNEKRCKFARHAIIRLLRLIFFSGTKNCLIPNETTPVFDTRTREVGVGQWISHSFVWQSFSSFSLRNIRLIVDTMSLIANVLTAGVTSELLQSTRVMDVVVENRSYIKGAKSEGSSWFLMLDSVGHVSILPPNHFLLHLNPH